MNDTKFAVNITPAERVGRITVGLAAAIAAILLLQDAGSVGSSLLKVLLGLAGLDLVVTGALGHSPRYKMLGPAPASRKGER